MKQIVLLDIDRTIFDPESFLEEFYEQLINRFNLTANQKSKLFKIYSESKPQGYFNPQIFLSNIAKTFNLRLDRVSNLFWNQNLINRHLFNDSDVLFKLSGKVQIAVFSKGDKKFQSQKLIKFKTLLNNENIYIFPNKIENFLEVLKKYSDHKIYLVDDDSMVLQEAKSINPQIFTILIDRENKKEKNDKINAKVENLYQILALLNE